MIASGYRTKGVSFSDRHTLASPSTPASGCHGLIDLDLTTTGQQLCGTPIVDAVASTHEG